MVNIVPKYLDNVGGNEARQLVNLKIFQKRSPLSDAFLKVNNMKKNKSVTEYQSKINKEHTIRNYRISFVTDLN